MTDAPPREPLDAPSTARLTEFARSCGTAARAVSLYPAGHPAVETALSGLAATAGVATVQPFHLTVLPDGLLLDGRAPERPDRVLGELARVLHHHQVHALTLRKGGTEATWLSLLSLLARPAEELREAGGIGYLWSEHGGLTTETDRQSIELREVDYERLLRRQALGDPLTVAELFNGLLSGDLSELSEQARAMLGDIIGDPDKLAMLGAEIQERCGGSASAIADVLTELLRAGVELGGPDASTDTLANLASMLPGLTADQMTELLRRRGTTSAATSGGDAIQAVADAIPAEQTAAWVAESIAAENGASGRLAEAFQALVPDLDERRQLVSLIGGQMAESAFGQTDAFADIWKRAETLLTSYDDEQYVHDEYARELDAARTQAVEVEEVNDDPADRIEGWLATVDDQSLHSLDLQLLLDLLGLERDSYRWRDLSVTCVGHIEVLALSGDLTQALRLVEAIAGARLPSELPAGPDTIAHYADDAIRRLATGSALGHALAQLRGGDETASAQVARLCQLLGPAVVSTLAETLATERDGRTKRAVRDILLAFGADGRDAVRPLLDAPDWEVRQTAALLLRQFGGTEGLDELRRLLTDAEPLVQREAMRTMIEAGDERAFQVLTEVLSRGKSQHRDALVQELTAQRGERAVPLCGYLLSHLNHRSMSNVYLAAIELLGAAGGIETIEPLERALYQGKWWAPLRTRALRKAAARALRRTRLPEAATVLRRAVAEGSRGVRAAAEPQLTQFEARS